MKNNKAKDKAPIMIDEPYTCNACGRQNLKFTEIVYKEDEHGQIDESSVICKTCGLMLLWPSFKKMVKPGHEKDAEKLFKDMVKAFEYNYDRRLLRRVLKKS